MFSTPWLLLFYVLLTAHIQTQYVAQTPRVFIKNPSLKKICIIRPRWKWWPVTILTTAVFSESWVIKWIRVLTTFPNGCWPMVCMPQTLSFLNFILLAFYYETKCLQEHAKYANKLNDLFFNRQPLQWFSNASPHLPLPLTKLHS